MTTEFNVLWVRFFDSYCDSTTKNCEWFYVDIVTWGEEECKNLWINLLLIEVFHLCLRKKKLKCRCIIFWISSWIPKNVCITFYYLLKVLFNLKYPANTRVGKKTEWKNMFQIRDERKRTKKILIFDCYVIFYHKRYLQLIKKCFDFDPRLPKSIET